MVYCNVCFYAAICFRCKQYWHPTAYLVYYLSLTYSHYRLQRTCDNVWRYSDLQLIYGHTAAKVSLLFHFSADILASGKPRTLALYLCGGMKIRCNPSAIFALLGVSVFLLFFAFVYLIHCSQNFRLDMFFPNCAHNGTNLSHNKEGPNGIALPRRTSWNYQKCKVKLSFGASESL